MNLRFFSAPRLPPRYQGPKKSIGWGSTYSHRCNTKPVVVYRLVKRAFAIISSCRIMARVVSRRPGGQARSISQPTRFLIVGREGTRELGEYLAQFLFARGNLVDRLLGFDHAHRVSTYRLGINETAPWTFLSHGIDLVIGLDNSSIGFEAQLNMDGTLLLDASLVTTSPSRE